MELNGNERRALRVKIDGAFNEVYIEYNIYPVINTLHEVNDAHKTLSRAARRQLEEYVGEWPLLIVAYSRLADALAAKFDYDKEATPRQLLDLLDQQEVAAVADSVIASIEAMPFDYEVVIPLKSAGIRHLLFEGQASMHITDQVRFFCADDLSNVDRNSGESRPPDLLAALTGGAPHWDSRYTYFGCKVSGYVSNHFATAPIERGVQVLKAIVGMGVARGVFDVERIASTGGFFRDHIQAFSLSNGESEWTASVVCNDATATVIGSVRAHPDALKCEGRERAALLKRFVQGSSALCLESSARLRRGASWYLDSRLNAEALLSFIQAVTCLEVLLGDKAASDRVGLGTLLANRCAYQVALSAGDRARVLDNFKNVYEKRSRILHSGHDQLSGSDRLLLMDAQFLCTRTLNSELRLLVNEHLPYNELWR